MIEQQIPNSLIGPSGSEDVEQGLVTSCPICRRSDTIAKASVVARSGRGSFTLENGGSANFETDLAKLLAEPRPPQPVPLAEAFAAALLSWLILVVDVFIVEVLRSQDLVALPQASLDVAIALSIGWFGVLVPLVAFARYSISKNLTEGRLAPWRESVAAWHEVYYCSRDDIVFRPGDDEALAPEDARVLWTPTKERRGAKRPVPESREAVVTSGGAQ